ncbi:amino acid ABC transporter substrate-binding protein [Azospirillum cavernae]|uniref:Amino acid ABC transporter substrate-binding protein n=1 Tax=Azospirillum cavernae TaxID=2320860 RepID=A0A418VSI6_9PROT|nr:ABC transporter substrate-binding protein [Azospirillum cavernae]RJF79447.1 amino acid ABC transporter substrate-binding protein [Azospirillum cavernae]
MRLSITAAVFLTVAALSASLSSVRADTVTAHARPRPPELTVESGTISGPLKDVLDEAVAKMGVTLAWENVPFPRSVQDLQSGKDVIVPRVRRTADREPYITFLGPIAVQKRKVYFLAPNGKASVSKYEDLAGLTVGIKRGTAYFDRFDADKTLKKVESNDDGSLVNMLSAGRFDVIATVDKPALDATLKALNVTNVAYAPYQQAIDGENYYGMAKNSGLAKRAAELDGILKNMAASGRVAAIYGKYNLNPEQID